MLTKKECKVIEFLQKQYPYDWVWKSEVKIANKFWILNLENLWHDGLIHRETWCSDAPVEFDERIMLTPEGRRYDCQKI
jgi:sulfatase maturation enzyme AslB (radical SAM superfamily)